MPRFLIPLRALLKKEWRGLVVSVILIPLLLGGASLLQPDAAVLRRQAAVELGERLGAKFPKQKSSAVEIVADPKLKGLVESFARGICKDLPSPCPIAGSVLPQPYWRVNLQEDPVSGELFASCESVPPGITTTDKLEAHRKPYDLRALIPALVAIVLALATRRVFFALSAGLVAGGMCAAENWVSGPVYAVEHYILGSFGSSFHLSVFVFTFSLVAAVAVATRSGGIAGLLHWLTPLMHSARTTRIWTFVAGLVIFFDDYANSIIIGTAMRPLCDAYRVSREKLSYLIDSTAAPVAGLSLVSTWIGYEVGLFDQLFASVGYARGGYDVFMHIIPFRFYCIFTIAFLAINTISGRDFGSMLKAERRALLEGKLLADGARPFLSRSLDSIQPAAGTPLHPWNALVPISAIMLSAIAGLLLDGGYGDAIVAGKSWYDLGVIRDALASAHNATGVLAIAGSLGLILAILFAVGSRAVCFADLLGTIGSGSKAMLPAFGILILAWGTADVGSDLGTGHYLYALFNGDATTIMLPVLSFLLSVLISVCTGSSWSTMALVLPIVFPLAYHQGNELTVFVTLASVLDGSIFGDHISPLSDTTLLSSLASSCDHLDHVHTQWPYATVVVVVALGFGYIPVLYGASVWVCYAIAVLCFLSVFYLYGKNPEIKLKRPAPAQNSPV